MNMGGVGNDGRPSSFIGYYPVCIFFPDTV